MNKHMRLLLATCIALATGSIAHTQPLRPGEPRVWGNAVYDDLAVGDDHRYLGRNVRLVSCHNHTCTVEVDGERETLIVAKLNLPKGVNGLRIFLADTRAAAGATANERQRRVRGAATRDALLCLSNPAKPLLDPNLYTFPVSREDGFAWLKGANSHQFAYLHPQLARGNPAGNVPSLRMAIENYIAGGRHPVGKIGVGTRAETVQLEREDFADPRTDMTLCYYPTISS